MMVMMVMNTTWGSWPVYLLIALRRLCGILVGFVGPQRRAKGQGEA
jgi:hypothetical protein